MKITLQGAVLGVAAVWLLALTPRGVAGQVVDPAAAVQAALDRYQSVNDEYLTKLRAATPEERSKLTPPSVDGFVAEFRALAEGAPGTEAAAKAWLMVVQIAPQGSDKAVISIAVERLARDHGTSEQAGGLGSLLSRASGTLGADVVQGHLRKAIELAPKGPMQAGALLGLASALGEAESTTPGSAGELEFEGLVARLVTDYADRDDARGRSYADVAQGIVFARKHLQVGKPVPEIEAADTQGVTFKLSDYRGKVVLLDFWGNW